MKHFAWGAMAFRLESEEATAIREKLFVRLPSLDSDIQYQVLLNLYAVNFRFPDHLLSQGIDLPPRTKALLRIWPKPAGKIQLTDTLHSPYDKALKLSENTPNITATLLHDILNSKTFRNKKNILLFVPKDRNQPGYALLFDSKGFVFDHSGALFLAPYLALSASNAPWFLTNGNTPAGMYRISGTGQSDNVFIGPSTTIITKLPFEASPEEFDIASNTSWSEEAYSSLLPAALRGYDSMLQTYIAGELGRTEIILHGSTIDPEFFSDESFYPFTPSLGCMTALELWNPETGKLLKSSQQELVTVYSSMEEEDGYLLVVPTHYQDKKEIQQTLISLLSEL